MLTIRIPPAIDKRLDKLARRTGRTKSFHAREAIIQHIEDLEDLYLAEQAFQRIRDRKDRTIPLEDMLKRYAVEG